MAIGDLVATLTVPGDSDVTFAVDNPDFSVSGDTIVQAVNLQAGFYSMNITVTGPNVSFAEGVRLDYIFVPPPPPPPPLTSTVGISPSSVATGQTATVVFTWNDAVINFTPAAVAVTNGSIGTLTQVDATHFTAIFTPTPNTDATGTIQVQQSGTGGAVYSNSAGSTTTASNIATIAVNTGHPPSTFYFGLNISGAENQFPVFVTPTEMTYWVSLGITYFRFPFNWSKANPIIGLTTGIQPTAFGPLDTTAIHYPLQGNNRLYNSDKPTLAPWQTFAAAGSLIVTPNIDTGPNGHPAHLISAARPDGITYQVFEAGAYSWTPGPNTWSFYYKAQTILDVGKNFQINLYQGGQIAIQNLTLTDSWQFASTTATLTSAAAYAQITVFGGSSSTSINILFSEAQVNVGSSVLPYRSTIAGYVQAMDDFFDLADSLGVHIILDCHMFGGGPGNLAVGSLGLPISAMVDMWNKVGVRYVSRPSLFAIELMNEPVNGSDVSVIMDWNQQCVTALRAAPINFTGEIHLDGTNYTGSWNYVSGEGQPFNNANLYQVVDPLNNVVFPAHSYFDRDSSGSNFSYAIESVTPGVSPPGISTNPTIGVTRASREYIPWLIEHNVNGIFGESGISVDPIANGGNNDWRSWITIGRNAIDICRTNNVPFMMWGAGPGFGPSYAFNPVPYNPVTGAADFTSTGVQSVLVAGIINHYVTNPQPQPTAYALRPPVTITPTANPEAPIVTTNYYGTSGVATSPFTIIYGGIVPSGVVITPHAYLSDGVTSAGGTFTPSSITLTPGENALATFTYTPAITDTILIRTTNNQSWTDPPALVVSTQDDAWKAIGKTPAPLFNLYRSYTPYIGTVLRLQSPLTGAIADWSFTNGNNFDRVAIQTWAGQQSGIPILISYDQSPAGEHRTYTGTLPTLTLQNSAGYPEISHTVAAGSFNFAVNGLSQMTVGARINQGASVGQGLFRIDQIAGPIFWTGTAFQIISTGWVGSNVVYNQGQGVTASASLGIVAGAYHEYAATYQAGVANGTKTYRDGSLIAQASTTASIVSTFTLTQSGTTATVSNYIGAGIIMGDTISGTGVTAGTAFVSQVSGTTGGNGVYTTSLSGTASAAACQGHSTTYTLNAAFSSTLVGFGNARFNSGNWNGKEQSLWFIPGVSLTSGNLATVLGYETTHYSTPLPDTFAPILTNVSNRGATSGVATTPFSAFVLQDASGISDSIVFTLTGNAATLAGTGLTGSNPYTLTSDTVANINTKLQALQFTTTGSAGAVTDIAMVVTSSTALTCTANPTVTITAAVAPVISGMVGPNVSQTQGAPALWKVSVTDANPGPLVSASVVVTGSAGTMSYLGTAGLPIAPLIPWDSSLAPSGTGPYTFAAMTPDRLTRALRNLMWLPTTTTVGTTTTFTVTITNGVGLTASASNTITNIATAAMPTPLTPVATPGTLPRHYKGFDLGGGENWLSPGYPSQPSFYTWAASKGLNTLRVSFLFSHMQKVGSSVTAPGVISQLFANFNSAHIAALQACVEQARANGQYVILDDHSYGGIINPFPTLTIDDANIAYSGVYSFPYWGTDIRVPKEGFADSWARMVSYFLNYPNVLLGLQNEPAWTAANALAMTQATAALIRPISATVTYIVPSPANVNSFMLNYAATWVGYTDPVGGPFLMDAHQYFDGGFGSLETCSSHPVGYYFDTYTAWLRTNGFKTLITEFAYGNDATCMSGVGPTIPAYFTTNADVYLGWTWFAGGNLGVNYTYYMGANYHSLGVDPPQLPALMANLANTF